MPKKIYDIKPPKVAKKQAKAIKEFLDGEEKPTIKKAAVTTTVTKRKKEKKSVWLPVSIGVCVVLLIVCVYLFFKLPKADIVIYPKVDILSFKQAITADKTVDSVDLTKANIPVKYFEATKTVSQDFPATGSSSDGGLASGTITIFNKQDPAQSFTFKAGTHFMADSGKLFVAPDKIVIPAAKKSGSKITPGSVQVKVQAVEGGEVYNIAPSNFVIPGLKGTPAYYSVYATSSTAMTGGFSGKIKKVTDDDIQGAKDVLVKKSTDDGTADLKNQISNDYTLLDDAISSITTSASTPAKAGAVADKFTYSATVKVSGLAFKKSDLNDFAKQYIISQMPEGKTLLENTFKVNYTAGTVDVSGGKAGLNLDFSSGVYQSIDKNSMAISLMGKDANQINQVIKSSMGDQVENVKINFWPFWVSSAPANQSKVHVDLKFQ
jgi:hypothetical protein